MKYGKYEYERSFILDHDVQKQSPIEVKNLTDIYLIGTSLRLRKVEKSPETQYKLTQKQEEIPARKGVKKINTIYLSQAEYEMLSELPGYKIEKVRYIIVIDQRRIAIDSIQLGQEQFYISEVEFETEEQMRAYFFPLSFKREVTDNPDYSGFEIARKYADFS